MIRSTYSKYKSNPTMIDGIRFDSQKEASRYCTLKLLLRAGEITDLRLQVAYELIPTQREPDTIGKRGGIIKGKVLEKKLTYVADFVYRDKDGNEIVEDVKGFRDPKSAAYKVFTIKRKLMLYKYGIKIKET